MHLFAAINRFWKKSICGGIAICAGDD